MLRHPLGPCGGEHMKTIAQLLAVAICVVSVATVASAQATPLVNIREMIDANAPPATPDRFVLHDIVLFLDGKPMAFLTDRGRRGLGAIFCRADQPPAGCEVKEITREHLILIDRRSGDVVELKVADTSAEKTATPARGSKEWLNSEANPMRRWIVSPPYMIYENWGQMSDGQKAELAAFYESYGWKLVRAEIVAGATDIAWEPIDQAERIAAAEAKRAAFANLLSPEQTALWQQMQSNGSIYAVNGKFTDEQRQMIAERQKVIDRFRASFTPDQKAAYEEMLRSRGVAPAKADGRKLELILPGLAAPEASSAAGPAPYTRAWINSRANPMLTTLEQFPSELSSRWPSLTFAERTQVIEYYRKHGWQYIYLETVSGSTSSTSSRNIYEKERTAARKAMRETFLSLLSPEQRQAWKNGPTGQTIYIKDGNPDYARNHNRPAQQEFFDPFWAALDARQRSAYEDMLDFTRANWN